MVLKSLFALRLLRMQTTLFYNTAEHADMQLYKRINYSKLILANGWLRAMTA